MKKKNFKIMSMLLLISCMLTLNVYAATRASDQIAAYDGDAIACGSGRLAIEFSIDGTDQMKKLGASKSAFPKMMAGVVGSPLRSSQVRMQG